MHNLAISLVIVYLAVTLCSFIIKCRTQTPYSRLDQIEENIYIYMVIGSRFDVKYKSSYVACFIGDCLLAATCRQLQDQYQSVSVPVAIQLDWLAHNCNSAPGLGNLNKSLQCQGFWTKIFYLRFPHMQRFESNYHLWIPSLITF